MGPDPVPEQPQTKGERTAARILDAAEHLFAAHGYEGTSLRQIARDARIREPGLYNHFAGKRAIYEAVLFRALNPLAVALSSHMHRASSLREYTDLPSIVTDLLLQHPQMASLFQRALQSDAESIGNQLIIHWLERLFRQGMDNLAAFGGATAPPTPDERTNLALNIIAMFNLTTGYFLSQRAFATLAEGDLLDPENIARQKRLLHKVVRAMLIS